jgi:N utilization substance protein A
MDHFDNLQDQVELEWVSHAARYVVPAVDEGKVTIEKCIVLRTSGAKISIRSEEYENPVGPFVGQDGCHVEQLSNMLGVSCINVVNGNLPEPKQIAQALYPADVESDKVYIDGDKAKVVVPEDEIGRAIGKNGHNIRQAERLLQFDKIKIKST